MWSWGGLELVLELELKCKFRKAGSCSSVVRAEFKNSIRKVEKVFGINDSKRLGF